MPPPFKVGDRVQVISGPHAGTVAEVYSRWQGKTFRVQISLEAQRTFEDVFGALDVMRVGGTEMD